MSLGVPPSPSRLMGWLSQGSSQPFLLSEHADAIQERGPAAHQNRHAAPDVSDSPELADDRPAVAEDVFRRDDATDGHCISLDCELVEMHCDLRASGHCVPQCPEQPFWPVFGAAVLHLVRTGARPLPQRAAACNSLT